MSYGGVSDVGFERLGARRNGRMMLCNAPLQSDHRHRECPVDRRMSREGGKESCR